MHTVESLAKLFDDYYAEATCLREKYSSELHILVGFESEWIRSPESLDLIKNLQMTYHFDFFVGSVHHVHSIPVDFDKAMYEQAREAAGGTDEKLFEDYFDSQFEMLQALKPIVVGHFDLIRLLSDAPNAGFKHMEGVWRRAMRNLEFIGNYGGILELNSAALRKGLDEPYPCLEICQVCFPFRRRPPVYSYLTHVRAQVWQELGGRFTLSDDSHGIDQVGTNYNRLLAFIRKAGIQDIHFLKREEIKAGSGPSKIAIGSSKVSSLEHHPSWE